MALRVRRVITGHDAHGKAVVKIDEVAKHVVQGRPGVMVCNVWSTDTWPSNNDGEEDMARRTLGATVPNGTIFRILEFSPGLAARKHRTDSIDYIVVLSSEINIELDDATVHLQASDTMVQRGTIDNWVNSGTAPCVLAVILVHAMSVEPGRKTLPAIG